MLTAEELRKHPAYPNVFLDLPPAEEGKVLVGADRACPAHISYEVHGHGPKHLLWIMGLGSFKTYWQRQTKAFGHENGDKYSCLILDNRGMGKSDKPLGRYTTSMMAKDVVEVLDHIGWTSERSVHVIGISMGGMIAQELGLLIPTRVVSMSLISTAARLENTVGFVENMRSRINMFIPKSIDVELRQTTDRLLGPVFLEQPDVDGEFPTNRDRWGAQELRKREDKEGFTRKGFFGQLLACGWHHKSAEELRTLGDKVGRHRILIAHGTNDRVISPPHCHVLINELAGEGLSHRIFEGEGHVIPVEKRQEFNDMIEMHVEQSHRSEENGSAAPK